MCNKNINIKNIIFLYKKYIFNRNNANNRTTKYSNNEIARKKNWLSRNHYSTSSAKIIENHTLLNTGVFKEMNFSSSHVFARQSINVVFHRHAQVCVG